VGEQEEAHGASDHVAMVSHPGDVLDLIQAAARAVPVAG
jgi:hypothetical protein